MGALKKFKASTLMETMVASVLIVIIFMISSLILNSLFSTWIKSNLQPLKTHLHELEYFYVHNKISIPFYEEWETWEVTIKMDKNTNILQIEAAERENLEDKIVKHTFFYAGSQ